MLVERVAKYPTITLLSAVLLCALGCREPANAPPANLDAVAAHAAELAATGNYEAAQWAYGDWVMLAADTHGRQSKQYSEALFGLADVYDAMGRCEAAEPLYAEALSVTLALLDPKSDGYCETLHELAAHHWGLGHSAEALPLFKELAALMRSNEDTSTVELAGTVATLGDVYFDQGRYRFAADAYAEARSRFGDEFADQCATLERKEAEALNRLRSDDDD